jgi:chemotaxis protein CheX
MAVNGKTTGVCLYEKSIRSFEMNVEYINPFTEAAFSVLQSYLHSGIKRGDLYLKNSTMSIQGVAAMVGLAGDVEGRVLFDMTKDTALAVATAMAQDMNPDEPPFTAIDEMVMATIQELANQITGQAVSKLHEKGFKFDLTPPAIFSGDNMEISNSSKIEALIVPMDLGESGKIEVNVAIREKA